MEFTDENIVRLFGQEAAEDEDFKRLSEYYVKNKTHKSLTSDLPLRILVGHKGIGKSAVITIARHDDEKHNKLSVLIRPDDIANIGKNTSDFSDMMREWKTGLIQIVANKIIDTLGLSIVSKEIPKVGGSLIVFLSNLFSKTIESKVELSAKDKPIVQRFLSDSKVIVYIDDLDRGWQSQKNDIRRISALLNAVRDLSNDNKGLQFRISLRTDVYYLVRTSDESTDKIEGAVIWHSWTNDDILLLLIKRIESFFGRSINIESLRGCKQSDLSYYLDPVFEERFNDTGKWSNAPMYRILMTLIRKRPRDLVKLCSLAAKHAYLDNAPKIRTKDFKEIFVEYSQGRMQDTINEYRSELPDIERLLLEMKPSRKEVKRHEGYLYSTQRLKEKIRSIMQHGKFIYRSGKEATEVDLLQFMYKINFITARKENETGYIDRKYFQENQYLTSKFVDFGYEWEIHPAFRWVLEPNDFNKIFQQVDLYRTNECDII